MNVLKKEGCKLVLLTDHRINLTVYSLDKVMEGDLDEILDALSAYDQTERLKSAGL